MFKRCVSATLAFVIVSAKEICFFSSIQNNNNTFKIILVRIFLLYFAPEKKAENTALKYKNALLTELNQKKGQ